MHTKKLMLLSTLLLMMLTPVLLTSQELSNPSKLSNPELLTELTFTSTQLNDSSKLLIEVWQRDKLSWKIEKDEIAKQNIIWQNDSESLEVLIKDLNILSDLPMNSPIDTIMETLKSQSTTISKENKKLKRNNIILFTTLGIVLSAFAVREAYHALR